MNRTQVCLPPYCPSFTVSYCTHTKCEGTRTTYAGWRRTLSRDCEGIQKLGRGEHEGLGRGTSTPRRIQNASSARAATAMARDASASCSAVETCDRRPGLGVLFRRHEVHHTMYYCAVPGPRNGLHCMCSKAHPDKAPRGPNTTYSRLLEGRCVGCRRVGQIGEASKTRAVPRCPGVRWRWMCTGKGVVLWRGVRNRSTRSVGLYVLGLMFVLREHAAYVMLSTELRIGAGVVLGEGSYVTPFVPINCPSSSKSSVRTDEAEQLPWIFLLHAVKLLVII